MFKINEKILKNGALCNLKHKASQVATYIMFATRHYVGTQNFQSISRKEQSNYFIMIVDAIIFFQLIEVLPTIFFKVKGGLK